MTKLCESSKNIVERSTGFIFLPIIRRSLGFVTGVGIAFFVSNILDWILGNDLQTQLELHRNKPDYNRRFTRTLTQCKNPSVSKFGRGSKDAEGVEDKWNSNCKQFERELFQLRQDMTPLHSPAQIAAVQMFNRAFRQTVNCVEENIEDSIMVRDDEQKKRCREPAIVTRCLVYLGGDDDAI